MNLSGDRVGEPFRIDMGDISGGGASFMSGFQREAAGLLLGKRLHISYLPQQTSGPSHVVEQSGTIAAVRFHPIEDCAVSLKFDSPLPEALLDRLEQISPPPDAK